MVKKKDKMTIEDLAGMMERNFPTKDEMSSKFNELRVEFKGEIGGVRGEIQEVRNGLWEVKNELEEVHEIVKRIDGQDLPNLKRRITTLETIVKPLRK
jgi:archaellum component FlaC